MDIARRVVLILAQSIVSFYIRLLTLLFVYMVMKCLKISFQLIWRTPNGSLQVYVWKYVNLILSTIGALYAFADNKGVILG